MKRKPAGPTCEANQRSVRPRGWCGVIRLLRTKASTRGMMKRLCACRWRSSNEVPVARLNIGSPANLRLQDVEVVACRSRLPSRSWPADEISLSSTRHLLLLRWFRGERLVAQQPSKPAIDYSSRSEGRSCRINASAVMARMRPSGKVAFRLDQRESAITKADSVKRRSCRANRSRANCSSGFTRPMPMCKMPPPAFLKKLTAEEDAAARLDCRRR